MMRTNLLPYAVLLCLISLQGCAPTPSPGPDKQFEGSLQGAALGAGSGAVTGFQMGVGTGAGAVVGAGLGAVAGGVQGFANDQAEENLLELAAKTQSERELAQVHEILNDHYRRRIELHPTRDIYPADLFFYGDEVKLRPGATKLVDQIARLNKKRVSWSRLVIASYVKAKDKDSDFAKHLARNRSRELCDRFVRAGIEPRRLEARAVVVDEPLLVDPLDRKDRYNQAIEIIPLDR